VLKIVFGGYKENRLAIISKPKIKHSHNLVVIRLYYFINKGFVHHIFSQVISHALKRLGLRSRIKITKGWLNRAYNVFLKFEPAIREEIIKYDTLIRPTLLTLFKEKKALHALIDNSPNKDIKGIFKKIVAKFSANGNFVTNEIEKTLLKNVKNRRKKKLTKKIINAFFNYLRDELYQEKNAGSLKNSLQEYTKSILNYYSKKDKNKILIDKGLQFKTILKLFRVLVFRPDILLNYEDNGKHCHSHLNSNNSQTNNPSLAINTTTNNTGMCNNILNNNTFNFAFSGGNNKNSNLKENFDQLVSRIKYGRELEYANCVSAPLNKKLGLELLSSRSFTHNMNLNRPYSPATLNDLFSSIYNKPVELQFVKLDAPFYDSVILSQYLSIFSKRRSDYFNKVKRVLFDNLSGHIRKPDSWTYVVKDFYNNLLDSLAYIPFFINGRCISVAKGPNYSTNPILVNLKEKLYDSDFSLFDLFESDLVDVIRPQHLIGIKVDLVGRMHRRRLAARSIKRTDYRGTRKYLGINTPLSDHLLGGRFPDHKPIRGFQKANLDISQFSSKTRNGAYNIRVCLTGG